MTDDIVTRLRDIANLRGDLGGHVIPLACLNAADEIERLQKELVLVRSITERQDKVIQKMRMMAQDIIDEVHIGGA